MAISGVADLTGRVLAGRYRLLSPVGAGASGRVYVADDVRLRRRVAVKVLHLALAEDRGFIRRFRAEAQVAASLNHPNVMSVFDWGEDEVPFMVLELLTGGSLRTLLDSGARLSPSQATHVGRQVAAALEYAHARGLVHRDIKPANLLFDEHGIVRVADFGLARALAEASWTEPAGTVVGTARYAAPEQATGAALDGRADLYSLAVVLVEAVTGSVPALGDTPLGTIAARSRTALVAPPGMGRLGPVVERAGRPDPDARYPDAATMRAALDDAAKALPPPQPLPLAGLSGEAATGEPTRIRPPAGPTVFDQDAPAAPAPVRTKAPRERGERRAPRPARVVTVVVALAIVAALAAGAVAVAGVVGGGGGSVAVPSVVGLQQSNATFAAAGVGLSVRIDYRTTYDAENLVIGQDPAPGTFLGKGDVVHLVVSRGPPKVAVPPVSSMSVDDATAALRNAGFVVGPAIHQNSDTVDQGSIISTQPPAGTAVHQDATVQLVISDGPAPVQIPDVTKLSYDDAAAKLAALGFKVTKGKDVYSADIAKGNVASTDPPIGTAAPKGSTVTVSLSKGPEMVDVPDVRRQTLDVATAKLQALGLVVDARNYSPGDKVIAQDPQGGTSVAKGTTVTLFF